MRYLLTILGITLILISGCSDDDNGMAPNGGMHVLQLSFQGVESLQGGYHYEGWAIIDDAPVSTGKFNVDAGGNLVDLSGNAIADGEFEVADDLASAAAIVVTIFHVVGRPVPPGLRNVAERHGRGSTGGSSVAIMRCAM